MALIWYVQTVVIVVLTEPSTNALRERLKSFSFSQLLFWMDASGHFVFSPLEGSGCSKLDESLLLIFCSLLEQVSFNSLPIARCLQFQKAIPISWARSILYSSTLICYSLLQTHCFYSPLVSSVSLYPSLYLICSSPIISASSFFIFTLFLSLVGWLSELWHLYCFSGWIFSI